MKSPIFKDPASKFYHHTSLIPKLEQKLISDRSLGLLVINIHGLDSIEESKGIKAYDKVLSEIGKVLRKEKSELLRDEDEIAMAEIGVPSFLIFLSEGRHEKEKRYLTKESVEKVSRRVEEFLTLAIFKIVSTVSKEFVRVALGHALVVYNPLIRPRRLIYRLIEEGKQIARLSLPMSKIKNKEKLQAIILTENISTVFQPIIHFKTLKPMGFEALTRGPKGTIFENPLTLFSIAKEVGLIFELDRLCRRKALEFSKALPKDSHIFINTLPGTIHDPEFRGKYLHSLLKDINRKPNHIVFEINERSAIDNYENFRDAVKYYTDQGISIAIDDAGTGYSTLEAIVELKPQYLKFDISIVKGVHQHLVKQEMVKMLALFAKKINATMIAEGIESIKEFKLLKEMGIELGQGFYFARPQTPEALVEKLKNKHSFLPENES